MSLDTATIYQSEQRKKTKPDEFPKTPFSEPLKNILFSFSESIIKKQGLNSCTTDPYIDETDLDIFAIGLGNQVYRKTYFYKNP